MQTAYIETSKTETPKTTLTSTRVITNPPRKTLVPLSTVPSYRFTSAEELRKAVQSPDVKRMFDTWGNPAHWDVSAITDMSHMFADTYFVFDISRWNTANVTNMSHMFHNAGFVHAGIGKWDVSKVTDMSYMFRGASFNYRRTVLKWNTSNVTDMSHMFERSNFDGYIADFDVGRVRNMDDMFLRSEFRGQLDRWTPHQLTQYNNRAVYNIIFHPKIFKTQEFADRTEWVCYENWNGYMMRQIVWLELILREHRGVPVDIVQHIKLYICGREFFNA